MMSSLNLYEMGMKKAASGPRSLRNPASGFAVESKGERDPDLGKASSRKTRLVARLRYYLAIRPMLQGTKFREAEGSYAAGRKMANSSHQFSVTPGLTRGPAFLLSAAPRPRQRDPGSSPG
ncbi:hypothetical protein SJA_C1-28570 [Sphingobium indicum UT26S]|uniref:Uncharacterized protein n=1 Tax=Sphingobium indicum (strain DSM 16413 / CCM 7287 / MTCC 6362 / UT26 / NBRC 101211 / UT26S) TaxID=452662 RepID=D4Z509_SPHIU|nr:hypothetical protein SJA_C1-28570 [Sphingobium indicum UT26S]